MRTSSPGRASIPAHARKRCRSTIGPGLPMPEPLPSTSVKVCAKLTRSLRVTAVRPDGYHEIDALMVRVTEPHDLVTVTPAASTSLTVVGPFAAGVPADPSNLVWRAAA